MPQPVTGILLRAGDAVGAGPVDVGLGPGEPVALPDAEPSPDAEVVEQVGVADTEVVGVAVGVAVAVAVVVAVAVAVGVALGHVVGELVAVADCELLVVYVLPSDE